MKYIKTFKEFVNEGLAKDPDFESLIIKVTKYLNDIGLPINIDKMKSVYQIVTKEIKHINTDVSQHFRQSFMSKIEPEIEIANKKYAAGEMPNITNHWNDPDNPDHLNLTKIAKDAGDQLRGDEDTDGDLSSIMANKGHRYEDDDLASWRGTTWHDHYQDELDDALFQLSRYHVSLTDRAEGYYSDHRVYGSDKVERTLNFNRKNYQPTKFDPAKVSNN